MRPILFALSVILLAGTAPLAGGLSLVGADGSPAIDADGSSSTTISAAGGAVSVTVESAGSLDIGTNSGTIGGGVGVPQPGIQLGDTAVANPSDQQQQQPATGDGDAVVSGDARRNAGIDGCVGITGSALNEAEIAALGQADALSIAITCDAGNDLAPSERDSLTRNDVLVAAAASQGYAIGEIVALRRQASGAVILYVPSR